jgi:hypothetical protein
MESLFIRSTRLPRAVALGLFALAAARVATVWDALPARVASHFGPSGIPDGWMSREAFIATMAGVGGGTVLLLVGIPALLRYCPPELVNLPNRDYWLAPARKEQSIQRLAAWFAWFAALTGGLVVLALELSIRANLERAPLESGVLLAALGLYAVGLVVLLVVLYRSFRLPRDGVLST